MMSLARGGATYALTISVLTSAGGGVNEVNIVFLDFQRRVMGVG